MPSKYWQVSLYEIYCGSGNSKILHSQMTPKGTIANFKSVLLGHFKRNNKIMILACIFYCASLFWTLQIAFFFRNITREMFIEVTNTCLCLLPSHLSKSKYKIRVIFKYSIIFPVVFNAIYIKKYDAVDWCRIGKENRVIEYLIPRSGPVFCRLLGVSSGYARPITGQVTSVTWLVIGWA